MPRFFGNAAAYFALLGMIAGSAVVTYGEIRDAIVEQFLTLGVSIAGDADKPTATRRSGVNDDLARHFSLDDGPALTLQTFDESLRGSEKEESTESSRVREHLLKTEELGARIANRLSGEQ